MKAIIGISFTVDKKKYDCECEVPYELCKKAFDTDDFFAKDEIMMLIENAIENCKKSNRINKDKIYKDLKYQEHYIE